jgi:hypothetical protein
MELHTSNLYPASLNMKNPSMKSHCPHTQYTTSLKVSLLCFMCTIIRVILRTECPISMGSWKLESIVQLYRKYRFCNEKFYNNYKIKLN